MNSYIRILYSGLLLIASMANAASTVSFDFTRDGSAPTPDREHYFGTHNEPTATAFDNDPQSTTRFFVQSGTLRASTTTSAWTVMDDSDPDNKTASSPNPNSLIASNIVLRTRIVSLTSAANATPEIGGFLVGLNGVGNTTADGYFLGVQNTVNGGADDVLLANSFTDGLRAANLNTSSGFAYGSSGTPYFLELGITGDAYTLKLYSDTSITGTGNDLARLSSVDFTSASAVSSITGTLPGYTSGWVGVYNEDDGGSAGAFGLGNFYADGVVLVPEPSSVDLLLVGGLVCGLTLLRRKTLKA